MIYNEKYNRYIDNDYVIYRKNKEGKLVQVKPSINNCGYEFICYNCSNIVYVHRLVYETFVGEIPEEFEIDHIDTNKHNNNPDNLILCTHKQNCNNKLSRRLISEGMKGKPKSDFGRKFKEHYGIGDNESITLHPKYYTEKALYYYNNNKCSWEIKEQEND